ncbi:MAG: hypothetical protein LBJ67_09700 [Planctomycetaceae bacterium]|nr:hypothetical protein [Planctomycetaceae bacterium]
MLFSLLGVIKMFSKYLKNVIILSFLFTNLVLAEEQFFSPNETSLFLKQYRKVLQTHNTVECEYTITVNSKNQYSNIASCDFSKKRYKLISQTLHNDTYITKDMFLHSTIKDSSRPQVYFSYINRPQNLFESEIASLAIAPLLGFCNHKIPDLILSEHYPGDFFKNDGVFFIPDILEKLKGVVVKKYSIEECHGVLFQWKQADSSLEIFILPEQDYVVKMLKYEDGNTPIGGIKSLTYLVDEIQKNNEVFFPKTITILREIQGGKGERDGIVFSVTGAEFNEEVKIEKIMRNRKFRDSDFIPSVPDNTPVVMLDDQQIKYVWLKGKLELLTDEVALRIARGDHQFIPRPKELRFWLIALGLIMIIIGFGLKLRSMLKENNKS